MDRSKKQLLKSYKQCIRRVERENDIIDRARDRKYYYKAKLKMISDTLGDILPGHLSFNDQGVKNVETRKKVQREAVSGQIQQGESNK